jgi:ParB-like chromosome segregation protein Spo0J
MNVTDVKVYDDTRALKSITLDPKNSRRHPEKQIARIVASIEKFGYVDKLVIRPNGQLLGGEGRWLALQRMPEYDNISVRVVDGLSETHYRMLALALNKMSEGSTTDDVILNEVLAGIVQEGEDPLGLGFSEKEIASILDHSGEELEVKEIATDTVEDEFWISVRGPLKCQAEMLKRLEKAAKGLDGVSVDLGTIAVGP